MGPLETEVAEILNASIRDTPLGLAVRVQGVHAAFDTAVALSDEQRVHLLLQAFTGNANAMRRIARHIDEANLALPDDGHD